MHGFEDKTGSQSVMTEDTVRVYFRFTLAFLFAGAVLGILAALTILIPGQFYTQPIPSYPRLVAAHRTLMIHGVLIPAFIGIAYTLLSRLTATDRNSGEFGKILAYNGSFFTLLGAIFVLVGLGSGREYSDFPVVISFLYWLFLLGVAINATGIIRGQKSITQHPSIGFLYAGIIFPAVVYPFTIPGWWGNGLFESIRIWTAWRALWTGTFLLGSTGIALWMIGLYGKRVTVPAGPFALGTALLVIFSQFLGFTHHLESPIDNGLAVFSAFAGALAGTGLILIVFSIWHIENLNPPAILLCGGLAGLATTAIQGITMMFPPVYSMFHFTLNTSGHAHLALGSVLSILLAGILTLTPRTSGRRLQASSGLKAGAGITITGLLVTFIFITSAGIIQAMAFRERLAWSDWLGSFGLLHAGIILGGVMFVAGVWILANSIYRTLNARTKIRIETAIQTDEPEPDDYEEETGLPEQIYDPDPETELDVESDQPLDEDEAPQNDSDSNEITGEAENDIDGGDV